MVGFLGCTTACVGWLAAIPFQDEDYRGSRIWVFRWHYRPGPQMKVYHWSIPSRDIQVSPKSRLRCSSFAWSDLGHSTLFMFTANAARWSKSVGDHLLRTGFWGVGSMPKSHTSRKFLEQTQPHHCQVGWRSEPPSLPKRPGETAKSMPKEFKNDGKQTDGGRSGWFGSEMKVDKWRHVDVSNTLQKLFKCRTRPRATWNNTNESHSDPMIV